MLAYGRDPYFPGWPDTVQLNYQHGGLREAMLAQLGKVADRCDGVRCDMAMLIQPQVFQRTWGDRAAPRDGSPAATQPFWKDAIASELKLANLNFSSMQDEAPVKPLPDGSYAIPVPGVTKVL